jgi:TPR repeat protein
MRSNSEGVPGADGNAARVWQRGATRRAILDAARLVAARDGLEAFSLNTVAKEAGYSTTTIFAYYSTKNDLFLSVLADDLATLARSMQETYPFAGETAEIAETAEAPKEKVANEPVTAAGEPAPEESLIEEPVREEPVQVANAPSATIVPLTQPVQRETEPRGQEPAKAPEPRRVDAWLERRLRVFEKSLGDIETRLGTAQRDSSSAKAMAEENSTIFGKRLDASEKRGAEISNDLTERMAAAEKRLRDASAELRTNLLNACSRIDMLEAAVRGGAADFGVTAPVEVMHAPLDVPEDSEGSDADAQPAETKTQPADSYLSAARRAAQTAAALAQMEQAKQKRSVKSNWLGKTTAIFAGALAVLFVTGATLAYAIGEHIGRATPIRIVVPYGAAVAHRHIGLQILSSVAPSNSATPLDRLSALANAGNPKAQLLIGLKYYNGDGTAANLPEAAKWIARAANARDAMAEYWLGVLYEHGEGLPADATQSLRWYQGAAGQGNRQAMHNLGIAYAQGAGTNKDYAQAARWFAKAAALGLVNSQFNLAVLYERGEGVPQSLTDAYKWYAIAAEHGDYESRTRTEAIAPQLGDHDLAAAKAAVAAFKPAALDRDANAASQITQRSGA